MKATTLKKAALVAGSLSFLAGSAFSQSAVSGAGGYETLTIKAGQFNVLGLRLHEPQVVSGTFDAQDGSTLTDNDNNFSDLLTAGTRYLVEITGATSSEGTVIEVDSWTQNSLNVTGTTADDATDYTIRAAKTIDDVFGADNAAGLKASTDGSFGDSSILFVPNGAAFDRYAYVDIPGAFQGWLDVAQGTPAGNVPLNYIDGLIVQEKGDQDRELVVTGMVKTSSTKLEVGQLFTYLGTAYPAGSTLGNSGLGASVSSSADGSLNGADVVYIPTADATGFDRYIHVDIPGTFTGWLEIATGNPADDVELSSAIIVDQAGSSGPYNATVTPPAYYADL